MLDPVRVPVKLLFNELSIMDLRGTGSKFCLVLVPHLCLGQAL